MSIPELLEGTSKEFIKGRFAVGRTRFPQTMEEPLLSSNVKEEFTGSNDLASAFIGWGIIRNNASNDIQSVLLHHPEDIPKFPKSC